MKIKLNYARQLWLSLLLLVGVAAIAVPGLNGTNSGGVAKIGSTEYATLQEAVDAAYADMTGDVTIELIADISANTVVRQNSGLNLTITGGEKLSTAKTITGQILIDGVGNYGSDVLTIQYIKFTGNKTDFVSGKDAFIAVPSPKTLPSPYTANRLSDGHNITITNCSFTSTSSSLDVVGFKSESNANVRGLTISNCTGTNLHSFAQLTGTTDATFTKCTANSSGSFVGVNGGGGDYVFSGCKLPSSKDGGYAIRVKDSSAASVTLSSNTFTATDAIILNTSNGSILVESGTYNGNITKSNGTLKISGGDFISGSDISTYFSDYLPATNQEINGQWVTTDKAFMVTKADGTISFSDSKTLSSAGTYKLLKDHEMYRIALTSNMANFTIDLNGHTLSQVSGYTDWPLIYATKSIAVGEINILDTSAGKGGKIIANAGGSAVAAISIGKQVSNTTVNIGEGVTIQGNTVLIEGANNTLNVNGTINGGGEFAVCTNGSTTTNATININEGAVLTSNVTAMYLPGKEGLKATVNGGTITGGDSGIEVRAGELTVNGGTITATASEYSYAPNGSGTTVKGAAIAVSQHGTLLPTTANVNGGTLTGTKTIAVVAHEQNTSLENVTVVAKDELVANNTEIPAGFKWVSSEGMSTLTPCDYVAQVGETKYETLADAFAAAADGNTITLLKDVSLTERLFVNAGATPEYNGTDKRFATTTENKSITLDLNGNNVTTSNNIALAGGSLNIVNNGTADADHGVISTTNAGLAPIEIRGTGDLTQKRTLTIGTGVTLSGAEYGLNVFGSNDAQKNVIEVNVNGTVEGTLFVLGNLENTANDVVINVNSGASLKGKEGIALNGFATVNVADNTTIEGTELGIEVRAGNLNVAGGTITSTATEYTVKSNGDGSAAKGAAISVAQHTTGLPISTYITGCTLTGVKTISVADPENGNLAGVTVKVADALANAETVIIPVAYKWVSDGAGMSTLTPRDPVAKIDETVYYSLADAVAAVPTDGTETTITLLADVSETLIVSKGKNIVLDLGGKTVTGGTGIGKGYLTIKNGTLAGQVDIYGSAAEVDNYNGITVDATATITSTYGIILREASGSKAAYGTTIDINGTVNGMVWVMGNITEGNSVINVNSGASIKGDVGVALNGLATVNVKDGATIEGSELGIEVRAGNLNVEGGNISSTATEYTVNSNGNGSAATGAAISVAQHTTHLPTNANITGGTLNGLKTISVSDPEKNNLKDVTVKVADALVNAETVVIPEGYEWVSDGSMSTLTPRDPVAKIDETVYYSLADAVAAVPTDGTEKTITLLANVSENVAVRGGKNIVLDLGEKTLTGMIDQYDSQLTVKNGNVAGTVYVNGGPASEEAGYNKFTLAEDATINANWGFILYQGPNGNDAYGSVIDINGTVNGTAWVMGNITEGNSVINVNSGATIEGSVFGLNGLATLNVKEGATIIGSETGIEVRAGNLNVEGGTITSTAAAYNVKPNGSGTTTDGAAIAISQHTTGLPINANILGGTLTGIKTISVADPEGGNFAGVVVTAKDELTEKENNVIPDGYIWVSNNDGTSTLKTKEDAGIFELKDWEVYPYLSYTEDKEAASVTYIRRFGNTNWQALYIPFDINDISELTDKYEFAKIHMVALENDGQWTKGDKIEVYYTKMTEGKIHANKPYLIKPKNTGEQSIVVENTILHDTHNVNPMQTETTAAVYAFTGTYEGVDATSSNTFFAMGGGTINFCDNVHLGAYRWYLNFEPKTDDYAKPIIDFIESDSDATGVSSVKTGDDSDIEGYYNINGVRSETPVRGINIIRYKNGSTRKVVIK